MIFNSYTEDTNNATELTMFKYIPIPIIEISSKHETCVILSLQGALAVSFSIFGTSFLFIDSHFTCKFSSLIWATVKNE